MKALREAVSRPGILSKLLVSFVVLSAVPLIVLAYLANRNLHDTGVEALRNIEEMGHINLSLIEQLGKKVIKDTVEALDAKSTEAIEVRTVDLANAIAGFLYERDNDARSLCLLDPSENSYEGFYQSHYRDVVEPPSTIEAVHPPESSSTSVTSSNPENSQSWRHNPPYNFKKNSIPLYHEITFVDLDGNEKIKITSRGPSKDLRNISIQRNTYCQAEDYFQSLCLLNDDEIYVSMVIGEHIPGWLTVVDGRVTVDPASAYAGKENITGKKFEGIIRWGIPVLEGGKRIGYCTLALDHEHVMQFTDHLVPTEERFSEISDAGEGNYAWLWDSEDRCISHPRDFFIMGFDSNTGREVPGWISETTYGDYLASGKFLEEFVRELPSFREFTQKKKGAKDQTRIGRIALDCKILDMAPQCQGWHDGTEDGGSGSFVILWSGLWKLTSYAAVPYFTGQYSKSKRGFGYVTFGANVDDFHKAANDTKLYIQKTLEDQKESIEKLHLKTGSTIREKEADNTNLLLAIGFISIVAVVGASVIISYGITKPIKHLTAGALAMRRGELNQRINVKSRDEIGELATSFNEMAVTVAKVDQMKSEFVTIASHELRTPIHSILLSVTGILGGYSGQINEEVREDLEVVKLEIDRLMRLVNDLLDLSRIEARKIQFQIAPTSISFMVNQAVERISELAASHHHSLENRLETEKTIVNVDIDRIVQVLINLLGNSVKYNPDGGSIIIDGSIHENDFSIEIIDNGYGIPDWAQKKVFDKFFQADIYMSQKVGGTGLGLSISRHIMEEHGGSIECVSPVPGEDYPGLPLNSERKGSIFTVNIPLQRESAG